MQFGRRIQCAARELRGWGVINGHGFLSLGSGAENGVQTQIHPSQSDLLRSPWFYPFKRVFLRKAHKARHSAQQTWLTTAQALPPISPVGPGRGPESRPVSFWVFSPVKITVLPQRGRNEGSQCDRCRLQAGCGDRCHRCLQAGLPKAALHASSTSHGPAVLPDGNSPSFTQFTGCKLDIFFYVIFMGLKAEQHKIQFSSKDNSSAGHKLFKMGPGHG